MADIDAETIKDVSEALNNLFDDHKIADWAITDVVGGKLVISIEPRSRVDKGYFEEDDYWKCAC